MAGTFIICNNIEEAKLNESSWGNEDFEISEDDIKALKAGKILAGEASEYGVFIKLKRKEVSR